MRRVVRRVSGSSLVDRGSGILLALAVAILLGSIGRGMWSRHAALLGPKGWTPVPSVLLDSLAPSFQMETLTGETVSLPQEGIGHLLIAYKTTCRFCESSLETWREVTRQICQDTKVIFASSEPLAIQRDYWRIGRGAVGIGVDCPKQNLIIGRVLDPMTFIERYRIPGTPLHLVISGDGHISRAWRGAVGRPASGDSLVAAFR